MTELMEYVTERVTSEVNVLLHKPVGSNEIREASFQMVPLKALDVDGFTVGFFQRH
jgi:hypothetical protein